MRLFIALDFNELKDYFGALQKQLPKNAKLSFIKSFHLTLKFLWEANSDKIDEIIGILRKIKFKSFVVNLDSIGIFSAENNIRVVWLGLNPDEKILSLQMQIDELLKSLFNKEKDFKAHITLARVKYLEGKKQFIEETKKIEVENKKIEIKNFKLIKSTLTSKGPAYEEVEVFDSN